MAVGSGADTIPYLFIGTFVAMLVATPIFGWVASRFPRRVFLPWVYLFFISNILIFWVVFSRAVSANETHIWLGRGFFVWLSVFNLFVVSVFWSLMADIFSNEQARRLFAFIAAGGTCGALAGPVITTSLAVPLGATNLLPLSALFLLWAVLCVQRLAAWSERAGEAAPVTPDSASA